MYLCDAQAYAEALVRHLKGCAGINQIDVAGSYRRRKEPVGDLDILVTCKNPRDVMDRLAVFEGVAEVLGAREEQVFCASRKRPAA